MEENMALNWKFIFLGPIIIAIVLAFFIKWWSILVGITLFIVFFVKSGFQLAYTVVLTEEVPDSQFSISGIRHRVSSISEDLALKIHTEVEQISTDISQNGVEIDDTV